MAIYQYEFKLTNKDGCSNIPKLNINALKEKFSKQKSWCPDNLVYGNIEDTCVEIFYFNNQIDEISVRINVATITLELLNMLIKFIQTNNLYLYLNSKTIQPSLENIIILIKESKAFEFLTDNEKFLDKTKDKP